MVTVCGLGWGMVAPAEAREERSLGVQVGTYLPSSGVTQRLFGKQWNTFSLAPRPFDLKPGLSQTTDVAFMGRDRTGNRIFILMPTYGVRYVMGDINSRGTTPYVAARVGPAYYDYSFTNRGVYHSAKRIGFAGHAEAGVWINRTFRVYTRYNTMSQFEGVRFDGLEIGLAISLFRF